MDKMIVFIIFITILIILIYNSISKHEFYTQEKPKSKCWIDNKLFPEAQKIFESKNTIVQDLIKILNSNEWSIWSSDYKTTPIFTLMSEKEIKSRLSESQGKINSSVVPSWRLYGLILNKEVITKKCANTINLLQKCSSRILNAGFSVLESGCEIGLHKDFNNKFYRLHIPLIIPKINSTYNTFVNKTETTKLCVMQVEQDYRVWKDNEYFIFDDTCLHNAFNNTKEIRIVLIVDLEK